MRSGAKDSALKGVLLTKYLGKITDDKDLVTKEYVDTAVSGAGSGDVTGPSSSTDGNIAVFSGTTGKVIADSGANIDEFVLAVEVGTQSTATPVNADTLESHAASYFATASDLSTLQDEVDAIDLSTYAPLASPALTGTPTAPTAASGTNTTQIATTAFVQDTVTDAIADKVDVTGDTMTGILTAQNNTSYTTKQVRNVFLSTAEPTSSDGANGDIWIVYTA